MVAASDRPMKDFKWKTMSASVTLTKRRDMTPEQTVTHLEMLKAMARVRKRQLKGTVEEMGRCLFDTGRRIILRGDRRWDS